MTITESFAKLTNAQLEEIFDDAKGLILERLKAIADTNRQSLKDVQGGYIPDLPSYKECTAEELEIAFFAQWQAGLTAVKLIEGIDNTTIRKAIIETYRESQISEGEEQPG